MLPLAKRSQFEALFSEVARRQPDHGLEQATEMRNISEAPRVGDVADLPVHLRRIRQRSLTLRNSPTEQKPLQRRLLGVEQLVGIANGNAGCGGEIFTRHAAIRQMGVDNSLEPQKRDQPP